MQSFHECRNQICLLLSVAHTDFVKGTSDTQNRIKHVRIERRIEENGEGGSVWGVVEKLFRGRLTEKVKGKRLSNGLANTP